MGVRSPGFLVSSKIHPSPQVEFGVAFVLDVVDDELCNVLTPNPETTHSVHPHPTSSTALPAPLPANTNPLAQCPNPYHPTLSPCPSPSWGWSAPGRLVPYPCVHGHDSHKTGPIPRQIHTTLIVVTNTATLPPHPLPQGTI